MSPGEEVWGHFLAILTLRGDRALERGAERDESTLNSGEEGEDSERAADRGDSTLENREDGGDDTLESGEDVRARTLDSEEWRHYLTRWGPCTGAAVGTGSRANTGNILSGAIASYQTQINPTAKCIHPHVSLHPYTSLYTPLSHECTIQSHKNMQSLNAYATVPYLVQSI